MSNPADRSAWLGLLAVLLTVCAACGHAVRNELVWDDLYVIASGDVIFDPAQLPAVFTHRTMYAAHDERLAHGGIDSYRPITLVTFFWDAALSGRAPVAYHVTNLLAHLACVTLVFWLAHALLRGSRWALFAAAFFGLSPLLAEAHVWIDGRSDVFCALFGLGAITVWRARPRTLRGQLVAGALFLLGLLSKEVLLLALPALVLWPEPEPLRARVRSLVPLAVAAGVYLAARLAVLGGLGASDSTGQLADAALRWPWLTGDALASLLVPHGVYVRSMRDDYGAVGTAGLLAAWGALLAVVAQRVWARGAAPMASFVLAWVALLLAPIAVIATVTWPGFGRYLYLPAAGVALGVASLGAALDARLSERRVARGTLRVAAVVYLLLLGAQLYAWTETWHDEETLYAQIIREAPNQPHGYGWLGLTYSERGHCDRAVPLLLEADARRPDDRRYLIAATHCTLALGDLPATLELAEAGAARFRPVGEFHLIAARAAIRTPPIAARHLVACLEELPGATPCLDAARTLLNGPLGAEYRRAFATALASEHSARARTALAPVLTP